MMPRDSRALLPARIRTPPDRSPGRPMLSWALRLSRAFLARRGSGFPPPSLVRFRRRFYGRRGARRFRALPNARVDGTSRYRQLS
jgi:hypothetical protein